MNLLELDATTRELMRAEIEHDIVTGCLYISPRLSEVGESQYGAKLLEAVEVGNVHSFVAALSVSGVMRQSETYVRSGVERTKKVPVTAPVTLGEGEFNRYYIRALAARTLSEGGAQVQVVRAKDVEHPRPESEMRVGALIDADALLDDLRSNIAVDTALGVPAGPNSGLSVRMVY